MFWGLMMIVFILCLIDKIIVIDFNKLGRRLGFLFGKAKQVSDNVAKQIDEGKK